MRRLQSAYDNFRICASASVSPQPTSGWALAAALSGPVTFLGPLLVFVVALQRLLVITTSPKKYVFEATHPCQALRN
jgi:hypothetical protein